MKTPNKYKHNVVAERMLVIMGVAAVFGLTGCQQEGSAEKAGQKLDRTIENAEQKMEQVSEDAGEKISEARKSVADKAETSGQYLDDSVITLNVKAAILDDPLLKVSEIKVTTLNGTVQLSGTVDSQQIIDRATEVAAGQKDVKFVQNNLTVKIINMPELE